MNALDRPVSQALAADRDPLTTIRAAAGSSVGTKYDKLKQLDTPKVPTRREPTHRPVGLSGILDDLEASWTRSRKSSPRRREEDSKD